MLISYYGKYKPKLTLCVRCRFIAGLSAMGLLEHIRSCKGQIGYDLFFYRDLPLTANDVKEQFTPIYSGDAGSDKRRDEARRVAWLWDVLVDLEGTCRICDERIYNKNAPAEAAVISTFGGIDIILMVSTLPDIYDLVFRRLSKKS